MEIRKKVNFDHPDSIEWPLLQQHLKAISAGRPFDEPVYSLADNARTGETRRVEPSEFVIVEWLFVFHWPELRELLDTNGVRGDRRERLFPAPSSISVWRWRTCSL